MKTRREFLKTLLSGTAVLTVAVLVPVSLMARPKPRVEDKDLIPHFKWAGEGYRADPLTFTVDRKSFVTSGYERITSGYAQATDLEPLKKIIKTWHPNSSGVNVTANGLTRFYWTKGAPNG